MLTWGSGRQGASPQRARCLPLPVCGACNGNTSHDSVHATSFAYPRPGAHDTTSPISRQLLGHNFTSSLCRCCPLRARAGDRIESYANVGQWTPGRIAAARTGAPPSYDVLYDDSARARHVFPHALRRARPPQQPQLVTLFYACALFLLVAIPLTGAAAYSGAARAAAAAAPVAAAAALMVAAVLIQLAAAAAANKRAGARLCVTLGLLLLLPWVTLLAFGLLCLARSLGTTDLPWVAALFAPALVLAAAGAPAARCVRPFYGKIWAVLSAPWLLFLAALALKLDGESGLWPIFSRIPWLGVFAPLQSLVLALLALHALLPLVWEVTAQVPPQRGKGAAGGAWAWVRSFKLKFAAGGGGGLRPS
eukprot:TRINITY_DN3228_c0_g1_i2.p1 TRINITY_DN3228_c0_g1~~TRINITY_DN3228_c0_g1_i2.p1  ORF type:complete len:364 (-),score=98.92 TRINITY_DN3228_c0_g1_i2:22-1113(-)